MSRKMIVKYTGWTYDNGYAVLTRPDGSITRYSRTSIAYTLRNLRYNRQQSPESLDFWNKMIENMEKGAKLLEDRVDASKNRRKISG